MFIKGKKIHIFKDYDDYFYELSVSLNGNWKVESTQAQITSKAMDLRERRVKCPKNIEPTEGRYLDSYCQRIWDFDSKSTKTIQLFWTCP
jgi:hypothetical protein